MLKKFTNWFSKLITPEPTNLKGGGLAQIKCFKIDEAAIMPSKAHRGPFEDAAFDLFATEDILLQPNERSMVDTKLAFIIQDRFWIKLR